MASNAISHDAGGSLVGTLMVLVVLGGLAAVALTTLPTGDSQNVARGGGNTGAPGTSTPASSVGERSPGAGHPRTLGATAAVAACTANLRAVEDAVAAAHAINGRYPSAIGELVAGRWLSQAPVIPGYQLSLQSSDGNPTGAVLVNGQPGASGCALESGH